MREDKLLKATIVVLLLCVVTLFIALKVEMDRVKHLEEVVSELVYEESMLLEEILRLIKLTDPEPHVFYGISHIKLRDFKVIGEKK